jgi:hypothetical protein
MGGGHPIKMIAIPLMIMNKPMIAALFFINIPPLISPDFESQTKISKENQVYYKKRTQKREEKYPNVIILSEKFIAIISGGVPWQKN